jgi:pimeloyl-ACP methyl ester carboxylesterase
MAVPSRQVNHEERVEAKPGRWLAVEVSGAPNGYPVFLLHGTPGSKIGPRPRGIVLRRLGVRLISYDRPGYGGSDRDAGRTVRSAAADVAAIATQLSIERFAVVGRSGGGPHALACAAELGDRVSCTAVLVGLAPKNADFDWYDGMNYHNSREYQKVELEQDEIAAELAIRAKEAVANPDEFLDGLRLEGTKSDERVVNDWSIRRLLTETYVAGLTPGPAGWIDDTLALSRPWDVDLSKIVSRVNLWHGADDQFSPTNHTRWLAKSMPSASVKVEIAPGNGHFGAVEVLPDILSWIMDVAAGDEA